MPRISPNTANIIDFGFDVKVDPYNRSMIFYIGTLTNFNAGGQANVLGVAFSLVDSVGVELMSVDWSHPQITPSTNTLSYTLDLSTSPVNYLFQGYKVIGYIKDQDGTVYNTTEIYKSVCQPDNINEDGYVGGDFSITPDCINNVITVKEFTVMSYSNQTPQLVTKTGTLYYPTGTIAPVTFSGTPFNNNKVYTGEYRISNTTTATYNLQDDFYVLVTYITDEPFPIVCSNFIGDITCCISDVYNTYLKNCENAKGQAALQKYNSVLPSILNGLVKQMNGQDASNEVAEIKKTLNCNCGKTSLRQNQGSPTNPSIYSIVLNDSGATTIGSPTINGNTKTYNIASSATVISKGDTGDLAYTITQDTSTPNVIYYRITFNYDIQAASILTAIENNPTLLNQLNLLVTGGGMSITGLDGKCVIDLTKSDYSLSQSVSGSTLPSLITINGTPYNAPGGLYANDATGMASWLNSFTLGNFTAVVNSGTLTIQSVANSNVISTMSFLSPNVTKQFASTNATALQVFQAIINYLCNLSALQMALGNNLSLCTFDYNGNIVSTPYNTTQAVYNAGVASAICNITARMNSLTSITCTTLKNIFVDRSSISFSSTLDRIYGSLGGDCAGITDKQIANLVIAAINKYADVKTAYCAISCTAPGVCPDITNTNISVVGGNIGIYGVTWSNVQSASQTVTVKYRVSGTSMWIVSTSSLVILPNGNISGTSPFLITGTAVGTTYDIWMQNNCGGNGFTKQITTPTGSVYSGSYLLDNALYSICGAGSVTLYSNQPFSSGIVMYSDIGLTTPVTGYTYITINGHNIFGLNVSTGVVGTDTGTSCSNGVSGTYLLGNDSVTVCGGTTTTLYTNGVFTGASGNVIYTDPSLTNPQTGYSYVVYSNTIYTINSVTGAITGNTGLSCTPPSLTLTSNTDIGGGRRSQSFQVGSVVNDGNRFSLQVYSHNTEIVASSDTPVSIATKLRDAINGTSEGSWNDHSSAPAHGTAGFPPVATASGDTITIVLNISNVFAATATVS